jgi:hypothetical protein
VEVDRDISIPPLSINKIAFLPPPLAHQYISPGGVTPDESVKSYLRIGIMKLRKITW